MSAIIFAFGLSAASAQESTKFRGPPTASEIQQETDRITERAKSGDVEAQKMLWAQKVGNGDRPVSGDLQSKSNLKCLELKDVQNSYTPADLYRAVSDCIKSSKYDAGASIWILAGVYGTFDKNRVADKTAHSSIQALQLTNFSMLSPESKAQFQSSISKYMAPENLARACADIAHVGPPAYYPRYMVQHGMSAFTGTQSGDGLVKDFDPPNAWKSAMNIYMRCDKNPEPAKPGAMPQNSQDKITKP